MGRRRGVLDGAEVRADTSRSAGKDAGRWRSGVKMPVTSAEPSGVAPHAQLEVRLRDSHLGKRLESARSGAMNGD